MNDIIGEAERWERRSVAADELNEATDRLMFALDAREHDAAISAVRTVIRLTKEIDRLIPTAPKRPEFYVNWEWRENDD